MSGVAPAIAAHEFDGGLASKRESLLS